MSTAFQPCSPCVMMPPPTGHAKYPSSAGPLPPRNGSVDLPLAILAIIFACGVVAGLAAGLADDEPDTTAVASPLGMMSVAPTVSAVPSARLLYAAISCASDLKSLAKLASVSPLTTVCSTPVIGKII